MEDIMLKCPVCCEKSFSSKSALLDHLTNLLDNIVCPICSNKWSSVEQLIEHLTLDNCQADSSGQTIFFDIEPQNEALETASTENLACDIEQLTNSTHVDNEKLIDPLDPVEDGTEMGKMYVELLSKQLTKPCLQTQELKLVKEHGVSRYLIMASEDSNLSTGSTVVTKQNNDGTVSLTTVKDNTSIETETDTVIMQENDIEDNQEEIYSCNTCGVSFTSVLDHIQNYHTDQDVVVEEPIEENGEGEDSNEGVPVKQEGSIVLDDKLTSRRMITETGDIVEAPMILKSSPIGLNDYLALASNDSDTKGEVPQSKIKEEFIDKDGRLMTRRYVQIDKFCDSVVKDIKQPDDKNGPYHKVIVKEMETPEGQKVKVFNCMSCNIYVSTLGEFKSQPCKALKYTCPHCPVAYENSKSLCAHMKIHKPKDDTAVRQAPVAFECSICSTVFPTNKSLKLHKRMHDPVKSRPIEPPIEMPEGAEVSKDKYQCTICDKMIPLDYRAIHKESHKNTDKFNCDICNKKFQSSNYLEMHMNVHSIERITVGKQDKSLPYTCFYCDRRFARPHEKVKHERIHTGEKPHCCEICGKSFRVSYCLTLHMRTHTGARPYACSHCGKRFKAHSVYNHHLQTHSEVRAYKCPYCPKAFKTCVQLAGHKNSHTKPFSCQHCNRPFASLYAVRVHTETHKRQNNLKFSCSMCGASYARAYALKDHMKQVHTENVDSKDNTVQPQKNSEWIISTVETDSEVIQLSKDDLQQINENLGIDSELIIP